MQRLWARGVVRAFSGHTRDATVDATHRWRCRETIGVHGYWRTGSLKGYEPMRWQQVQTLWGRRHWRDTGVAKTSALASLATKASGSSASPPRASAAVETNHSSELEMPVRGTPPGVMPTAEDQATGIERLELEHPDIFKHNEVIRGPFGTSDAPVLVESAYESRIVGCTGAAAPNDHDLYWIEVRKDHPAVCPLCEQVFALKPAA